MSEEGETSSTQQEFLNFLNKNKIDISALKGTKEEKLFDAEEQRNVAIL